MFYGELHILMSSLRYTFQAITYNVLHNEDLSLWTPLNNKMGHVYKYFAGFIYLKYTRKHRNFRTNLQTWTPEYSVRLLKNVHRVSIVSGLLNTKKVVKTPL